MGLKVAARCVNGSSAGPLGTQAAPILPSTHRPIAQASQRPALHMPPQASQTRTTRAARAPRKSVPGGVKGTRCDRALLKLPSLLSLHVCPAFHAALSLSVCLVHPAPTPRQDGCMILH